MSGNTTPPTCYRRYACQGYTQEVYETASRDAGRRARALRQAGWTVTSGALGPQVTRLGTIRLTQLTIADRDGQRPPHPEGEARL